MRFTFPKDAQRRAPDAGPFFGRSSQTTRVARGTRMSNVTAAKLPSLTQESPAWASRIISRKAGMSRGHQRCCQIIIKDDERAPGSSGQQACQCRLAAASTTQNNDPLHTWTPRQIGLPTTQARVTVKGASLPFPLCIHRHRNTAILRNEPRVTDRGGESESRSPHR